METIGRAGSKTGLVMEKKEKKIDDRYRCQPLPGLQGQGGEQHNDLCMSK